MNNKTCFFIGNRYAPNSVKEPLREAIEKHITQYGVTTFIAGNYGNFDNLVQQVLIELKKHNPEIKIYLLAPYALNQKIEPPEGFDGTFYPEGMETVPHKFAIIQANRYMIQNSDYLIAYPGVGNSRTLTEYAQRREKKCLIKVILI